MSSAVVLISRLRGLTSPARAGGASRHGGLAARLATFPARPR